MAFAAEVVAFVLRCPPLGGNADFRIIGMSTLAFIWFWERRAAREPAVTHYEGDEIEIIPPDRIGASRLPSMNNFRWSAVGRYHKEGHL